jgi:hypothetical protein
MADELSQRLKERSLEVPVINPLTLAIEVARALSNPTDVAVTPHWELL